MKPSPEDKEVLMNLVILTWIEACTANKLPKSQAILSFVEFMTKQGASKNWAANRVLRFFTDQGKSDDFIIEAWEMINKPE